MPYPSAKQFLAIGKETTQGTGVAPTVTMPVDEFSIDSQFEQLKDAAWRGHMGAVSGIQQGVGKTEFDGKGPVFLDTFPILLLNILGDLTTTSATPNSHAFSLLNSGTAQPATHTFTHFQGTPATVAARRVPGACLSELTVKFNAESELFTCEFKGTGWPTTLAAAAPTSSPSTIPALASWRGAVSVGGSPVANVNTFEITIKRNLKPYYTINGTQNPYSIWRSTLEVTGKANFVADDEAPHLAYLDHTKPALQVSITNGGSGATLLSCTVDVAQGVYSSSKLSGGNEAIEYDVEWEAVSTSTNAGASGGMSPCAVTVQNSVASY